MTGTLLAFYRVWIQLLFLIAPDKAAWRVMMLFATPRVRKSREREVEAMARAAASDLQINGQRIRCYTWGSGAPDVLLVHGWEGRAGNMAGLAEALVLRGHTCIAFDAPAHGDSEGKRSTLFAYADVIGELLTHFPTLRIQIAHSFGSAASVYTLARSPHQIQSLILLSTPDTLEDFFNQFFDLLKLKPKQRSRVHRLFEANFHKKVSDLQVNRDAIKTNVPHAVLLHDRNDSQIPFANAEIVAKAWPTLKLIPLQDVGHYRMLWDDNVINVVLSELSVVHPVG